MFLYATTYKRSVHLEAKRRCLSVQDLLDPRSSFRPSTVLHTHERMISLLSPGNANWVPHEPTNHSCNLAHASKQYRGTMTWINTYADGPSRQKENWGISSCTRYSFVTLSQFRILQDQRNRFCVWYTGEENTQVGREWAMPSREVSSDTAVRTVTKLCPQSLLLSWETRTGLAAGRGPNKLGVPLAHVDQSRNPNSNIRRVPRHTKTCKSWDETVEGPSLIKSTEPCDGFIQAPGRSLCDAEVGVTGR